MWRKYSQCSSSNDGGEVEDVEQLLGSSGGDGVEEADDQQWRRGNGGCGNARIAKKMVERK
eukprot:4561304-Pyramimonas_sp.AAC.3